MATFATNAREKLFSMAIQFGFIDPISRRNPTLESELSNILVLRHQHNPPLIDWSKVPLLTFKPEDAPNENGNASAGEEVESADFFRTALYVTAEYPLFAHLTRNGQTWASKKGDVILCKPGKFVVMIENKLDAKYTGDGNHLENGQLALQAHYLDSLEGFPDRYLILLSGYEFFSNYWNSSDLYRLSLHREKSEKRGVKLLLLAWEDIFAANKQL